MDIGGGEGDGLRNTVGGGVQHGPLLQGRDFTGVTVSTTVRPRPRPPLPVQLPTARRGFVNRVAELAGLAAAVDGDPAGGPAIALLTGLGGIGKTALAVEWARREAARFPDGQLYADLGARRHHGAVDVEGVLESFLRALGVDPECIPASLADRVALFRSATAGRRLLVLLDNAEHAAEVGPLLPASGAVLVTSRRRLDRLVVRHDAVPVPVPPLPHDAGVQLVRRWMGNPGGDGVEDLVALCGGVPLALRAVGERLVPRTRSVRRLVDELTDERRRLRLMDAPDESGMREVLAAAYRSFEPATRRLYRLLGVHPGVTFTLALASAAGARDPEDAVGELVDAHLAEAMPGERYRLHDLVRLHAVERAREEEPEDARRAVLDRIVDHYRRTADAADRRILGDRFRLGSDGDHGGGAEFADSAAAMSWFEEERGNLLAVLRSAAAHGRHDAVWRLCESLWAYYHSAKHYTDWIEAHELGVEAARWDNRADAETRMLNQLARAHYDLADHTRARAVLRRADALLPRLTDPRLHGVVRESDGLISLALGEYPRAERLFREALRANEHDRHGRALQRYQIARAQTAAGRHREALDTLDAALPDTAGPDDPLRARIALQRGRALLAAGSAAEAVAALEEAAAGFGARGLRVRQADALGVLVEAAEAAGDTAAAERRTAELRTLRAALGLPDAAPQDQGDAPR